MSFNFVLFASLLVASHGCSYVQVTTADGLDVIGRTMELGGSGGELLGTRSTTSPDNTPPYQVVVHPRGESWSHPVCKGADSFVVHRGFVSIDLQVFPQLNNATVDGMNEDGLTISGHTLRQSVYQGESPSGGAISIKGTKICYGDLIPWALANFASVKALTDALRNVSVISNTIVPLPAGDRLHWAASDPSGDRVVLEYLDGELHVHQNEVGVMTNDPDYTWHLRNLNNYASIRGTDPQPADIAVKTKDVGLVPTVVGHGFNLMGIPGDLSPASRFVRLFYSKALELKNRGVPPTLREARKIVIGLLNNVWITKGTVALGGSDGQGQFEFTQYSLVKVPQKRLFHWRTYDNPQWQVIDLSHLDFTQHSSTPLDDGSDGILNVTSKLFPSSMSNSIFT